MPKKYLVEEEYPLSNQGIRDCIGKIEELPEEDFKDRQTKKAILLRVEEALLGFQKSFGIEHTFGLLIHRTFGIYHLRVVVDGNYYDPFQDRYNTPELRMFDRSLSMYGAGFEYQYRDGKNRISTSFSKKAKIPDLCQLLLVILIGVIVGCLVRLLPESVRPYPCEIMTRVQNIILGLMSMAAIPVVFLSVIEGIAACGSLHTLKQRGIRTIRTYLLISVIALLLACGTMLVIFPLCLEANAEAKSAFGMICSSLAGMFPTNIAKAFADGNMTHVVLIGAVIGCAVIVTRGKDGEDLPQLGKVSGIFSIILQWFCKLVPVALACMIAANIIDGSFTTVLRFWPLVLTVLGLYLVILTVTVIRTAAKTHLRVTEVIGEIAKPVITGFSTASSVAAFHDMKRTLSDKFRVEEDYSSVALSMGISFFSPGDTLAIQALLLSVAHLSGMEVSVSWIITSMILSFVTAIASPPIAGGMLALMTMVFGTLGIGESWYSISFLFLMLSDHFSTAFRVAMTTMVCACRAEKLGLRKQ